MSLTSNCKTDTTVKFTGQIGNDKVLFRKAFQVNCKIRTGKGHATCKIRNFI